MRKKNSVYDPTLQTIEIIYNLLYTKNGEVEYLELSEEQDGQRGFSLPSKDNQEIEYLKKEAYLKLSKEAREVIQTVLDSPDEVLELFVTSKIGLYSKRLLKKYFLKKWTPSRVERVFKELNIYVNELEYDNYN